MNNSYSWFIKGGVKIKRSLILVLLVTILLSVSAISAADTNNNGTTTNNTKLVDATQTKSVTNIESNSIENKVSNEYETITNGNSSNNQKTITKQTVTNDATIKTATSTTTKKNVTITSNKITAYANQTIQINATVKYSTGEKLKDAKVAIKINDKTIGQTRVTNGSVKFKYTLPLMSAKNYTVKIVVGETSTSLTGTKTVQLTIKRHDLKITLANVNTTSASKKTIKATVKYENGTLADGQKAVFKLNGVSIGSTTVKKGVASISYIVPTKAATYTLVLKVGETTVSKDKNATSKLIVTKRTPSISMDKLFFVKENSTVTLKAKLYNLGYANATGKVSFKIDGKTVGTVNLVNNEATYKYKASNLKKGYHVISIVYGGSTALNEKRVNSSLRVQNQAVSTYTYAQILEKANKTYEYILKNKRLPNYATINGNQLSMADLLYLMAQTVSFNNSYHNGNFTVPSSNSLTTKYGVQISQEDYLELAKDIINSYIVNGRAQYTIKTESNLTLSFADTVYTYTKIVSFMYTNKRLPNYTTVTKINNSATSVEESSGYVSTNKVPSGYEKYVASASNAYVNSTALKNAVQKAVSGVSGTYNQAVAIFNYVKDKLGYSSYSNTKYGAVKTLSLGYGNCVDQGHLLLGMLRTAMIPARYCHSTCYFRSGLVVGHVWIEAYVGGKWYKCDTTSNQNSFNNVVNWYKSGTVYRYTELYF